MGLFTKKKVKISITPAKSAKRQPIYNSKGEAVPSLDFYRTKDAVIKPLEDNMVANAVRLQAIKEPGERLPILQAIVNDFYSAKTMCRQLGPEYVKYFSKTWEHCHNSRNSDFCYVDKYEAELNQYIKKDKER